jgi:hypothetical protein
MEAFDATGQDADSNSGRSISPSTFPKHSNCGRRRFKLFSKYSVYGLS